METLIERKTLPLGDVTLHLRRRPRRSNRQGIAKVIVIVVLAILVGIAFVTMQREQKARRAADAVVTTLQDNVDAGLTPEQVHEKAGREPDVTRTPGKHRFVEEYRWKGPMNEYVVYAYYTTGATKLLEAVSMNEKMEKWEGDALKVR